MLKVGQLIDEDALLDGVFGMVAGLGLVGDQVGQVKGPKGNV